MPVSFGNNPQPRHSSISTSPEQGEIELSGFVAGCSITSLLV